MDLGSPSVTATRTATRTAVAALAPPALLAFRTPPATSVFRLRCPANGRLAIAIYAASIGQPVPERGAAVIGAVIAVGMAGAVIAGQRGRARQQRRAEDARGIGFDAARYQRQIEAFFLDHHRAATAHVKRCAGGNGGAVFVVRAGQAGRQLAGGANRRAPGGGLLLDPLCCGRAGS